MAELLGWKICKSNALLNRMDPGCNTWKEKIQIGIEFHYSVTFGLDSGLSQLTRASGHHSITIVAQEGIVVVEQPVLFCSLPNLIA